MEQPGLESALVWVVGKAGGYLTCCATVSTPMFPNTVRSEISPMMRMRGRDQTYKHECLLPALPRPETGWKTMVWTCVVALWVNLSALRISTSSKPGYRTCTTTPC